MRFVVLRYLLYAVLFLEVFFLPRLLSTTSYAQIEYYKYIAGFAMIILLGSHTGLTVNYYSSHSKPTIPLIRSIFILSLAVGSVLSLIFTNLFLLVVVPLITITFILEKVLQINSRLIFAVSFKPILACCTLLLISLLNLSILPSLDMLTLLSLSYVVAFLIWAPLSFSIFSLSRVRQFLAETWKFSRSDFQVFKKLSILGFNDNLGTILLFCYLFIDRYFLNKYYTSLLPSYSLAFSISQFVFIGLSSLAFTSAVYIGEGISSFGTSQFNRLILKSSTLFVFLSIFSVLLSYLFSLYNPSYDNLVLLVSYITLGFGFFYASNVLSPLILYRGYQSYITAGLFLALVANIFFSFLLVFLKVQPYFLIFKSCLFLSFVAVLIIYLAAKLSSSQSFRS